MKKTFSNNDRLAPPILLSSILKYGTKEDQESPHGKSYLLKTALIQILLCQKNEMLSTCHLFIELLCKVP